MKARTRIKQTKRRVKALLERGNIPASKRRNALVAVMRAYRFECKLMRKHKRGCNNV